MIITTDLDLSVILFVVCITVIIGGIIKRVTANSKAKAYAEYVEECKSLKRNHWIMFRGNDWSLPPHDHM